MTSTTLRATGAALALATTATLASAVPAVAADYQAPKPAASVTIDRNGVGRPTQISVVVDAPGRRKATGTVKTVIIRPGTGRIVARRICDLGRREHCGVSFTPKKRGKYRAISRYIPANDNFQRTSASRGFRIG